MTPEHSEPFISITPFAKGGLTPSDLLHPMGTVRFQIPDAFLRNHSGTWFTFQARGFTFIFGNDPGYIWAQRNQAGVRLRVNTRAPERDRNLFLRWSPTLLSLWCLVKGEFFDKVEIEAPIAVPPLSLIRYARRKKYLGEVTFPSAEALRSDVYELLSHIKDDIERLGLINAFWDQSYSGHEKLDPKPKREPDIHPTLHLLFTEWALMRGVEIIPENKTGAGSLDFAIVGHVEGEGPTSICVEVKHAHASDLVHGLTVQLPRYMEAKQARYGALLVLWFKGTSFDQPSGLTIQRIRERWLTGSLEFTAWDTWERLDFALSGLSRRDDIRMFFVDVSSRASASKA